LVDVAVQVDFSQDAPSVSARSAARSRLSAHAIPASTKNTQFTQTELCASTDNSVCVPVVIFVLSGIKWAYDKDLSQKMS
ncbi:MAG: hypothetical protein Q4C25_08865, partial [Bacillota bacterium]|nr:hypothetical protein [Bacillota bacterium]